MSVYLTCCSHLAIHQLSKEIIYPSYFSMADSSKNVLTSFSPSLNTNQELENMSDMMVINDSGADFQRIPEGYSVPHIILTSILVSFIMIVIVFGNLLVVIAIFTDKTLKSTQNWFIASLAVADFLLGLVIMPFSLANEMMGYWYFGHLWCDLWKAIDVLLCTASILSICLISLDRYWSITRALEYSRQRTPTRAALMITEVWFLSAVICVPPLIGWKNPLPVSDYPLCLLSDDIGYVLYSTMGSFYIPCVIMLFVYFKIFIAARNLARKSIRKKGRQISNGQSNGNVEIVERELNTELPDNISENDQTMGGHDHCGNDSSSQASTDGKPQKTNGKSPQAHSDINSDNTITENETESTISSKNNTEIKDYYKEPLNNEHNIHISNGEGNKLTNCVTTITDNKHNPINFVNNIKSATSKQLKISNGSNISANKTEKIKTQDVGKICVRRISATLSKKRNRQSSSKANKGWRTASLREHERHKRKLAKARERRATIVLGIVMAAFVLCWFPFFTLYIITSFCYCVGEIVFAVVFWAGYCNSALNPIIYTVFNRDFRHAFHRIICRNLRKFR